MTLPFSMTELFVLGYPGITPEAPWLTAKLGGSIAFDLDYQHYQKTGQLRTKNIVSPEQIRECNQHFAKQYPTLWRSIDCEGGDTSAAPRRGINRLKPHYGFPTTACAEDIGAALQQNNYQHAHDLSERIADMLHLANFNLVYAPVLDINRFPHCPVIGKIGRSYSYDPDVVVEAARLLINACRTRHITCVAKHFPGHGSARVDSHHDMVDINSTWSPIELKPYQQLAGELEAVMLGHLQLTALDAKWPTSLSKHSVNWIREHVGESTVIFSDDLQMSGLLNHFREQDRNPPYDDIALQAKAVRQALIAGVDCLVLGGQLLELSTDLLDAIDTAIQTAVDEHAITVTQLNQKRQRINKLKQREI